MIFISLTAVHGWRIIGEQRRQRCRQAGTGAVNIDEKPTRTGRTVRQTAETFRGK